MGSRRRTGPGISDELVQARDRTDDRSHDVLAGLLAPIGEQLLAEGLHLAHRHAGGHQLLAQGHDAAAKVAILGGLAFHSWYTIDDVYCRGIRGITAEDVEAARSAGFVIKLLGVAERVSSGVNLRVVPTMIPRTHPLASVHGGYNAVFVEADGAEELMFYGPGAGGGPTASAVLGDLVSALRRVVAGGPGIGPVVHAGLPATGVDDVQTSFSLTLLCPDQTGVLAAVAGVFAEHGVSVSTMRQDDVRDDPRRPGEDLAEIRIVTHRARNADLVRTVEAVRGLDVVYDLSGLIRVEADD